MSIYLNILSTGNMINIIHRSTGMKNTFQSSIVGLVQASLVAATEVYGLAATGILLLADV